MTADLILTNAVVYTMDSTRPWASGIAVADGTIVEDTTRRPNTKVLDLGAVGCSRRT